MDITTRIDKGNIEYQSTKIEQSISDWTDAMVSCMPFNIHWIKGSWSPSNACVAYYLTVGVTGLDLHTLYIAS